MGTFLEQTRIPLKLVIEKIWSCQKKNTLEQSCKFQSLQIWSQLKMQYSNEKLQNQSIRGQMTFGIQLQTFAEKCNTEQLQPKTWNADEKTHYNKQCNFFH